MGRPKGGYKNAAGKRVPGTTTITGRFKESGGLIYWAWNEGREGRDFRETRDAAAEAGTIAHSLVECHLLGDTLDLSSLDGEAVVKAQSAFQSYLDWEKQSKLEIVEVEHSFVSEEYQYGGTLDAIGEIDGKLCLLDWKSSNKVYPEMLIQLAAYKHGWEETHPKEPLEGGFHMCRFAKEYGDFAHFYFKELDDAWLQFLHFRDSYEIDKRLKKRV